ncbi:NADP-dependent oxidoreductase [Streptomyces mirabilis]|uniref:NADP-dependent oxidoreductase n=1 Tax=Streptomyces mirabilis TaxID=68239 RepID=UPI00365F5A2E
MRSKAPATSRAKAEKAHEGSAFHQYGDPDVLRYADVDQPVPGTGQVRVRVAATSFDPANANIRAGLMLKAIPVTMPRTPGIDVAGTVEALGAGVTGVQVVGFLPIARAGAAAEYVLAPADVLTPAPRSIPLSDAAALPLVGLTAWQALFEHAKLTAGQRVLVNGAGGKVGGYAVQLAKCAGAYVIATASSRVTAAGADEIIDHTAADVIVAVKRPVDVALNLAPVEPAQLAALLGLIRPGGVLVNTTVWMPAPADEDRGVRGINLFVHSDAEQLSHMVALIDRGELRVDVARGSRWQSCRPCTPPPRAHCLTARPSSCLEPDSHSLTSEETFTIIHRHVVAALAKGAGDRRGRLRLIACEECSCGTVRLSSTGTVKLTKWPRSWDPPARRRRPC